MFKLSRRALLLTSLPFIVKAEEVYPNKPIKLIVPYAAGGGTDAIARLVAHGVGEALNASIIVENIGAAGGNIASLQASKSASDGYTLLMANQGPMVVNPHLFKNMTVNPITEFEPITQIADTPLILCVPKDSLFKSLQELLVFAKEKPENIIYGSAGNGSASHIASAFFEKRAGFKAVHIPYRGAGPALNDLIGARTHFMVTTLPSIQGQIDGGTVRPLAITSATRSPLYKEVPTFVENGFSDLITGTWYGFVAPKGTPIEVINKVRDAVVKAVNTPYLRDRLLKEGAQPIGSTPSEFKAMMKTEYEKWEKLIPELGVVLN